MFIHMPGFYYEVLHVTNRTLTFKLIQIVYSLAT